MMNIYDCFQYFDEDLLLDIRLNVLNQYVKKFVITEATYTHNGAKKELNFNINNFKKFKDKINYLVIDQPPTNLLEFVKNEPEHEKGEKLILNGMARDYFQRENLVKGIDEAKENDMILISDLDEIPDLSKLNLSKIKKKIIIFEQKMFYYKLNLIYENCSWYGTKACRKKDLISPQWLRNIKAKKYPFWRLDTLFSNKKYQNLKIIPNGGWHFTNMKNAKDLHHKMNNFAHHPEYEDTKYSEEDMANFIKKKLVFYDHFSDKNKNRFENVNELEKVNDSYLPNYLVENYEKYKSLID